MRKVLIVGAGTSGLHLAHGLLRYGYDVTVVNGTASNEIRDGRLAPTQFTLPSALAHEEAAGLAMWDHVAPRISGATLNLHPPGGAAVTLESTFPTYGVSVDRRVRTADWLEAFEDRGGKVVVHGTTVSDLDYFSNMFNLVILATGHGEIGQLLDSHKSDQPTGARRALAQAIISGVPESANTRWHHVDPPKGYDPRTKFSAVMSEHAVVASTPQVRAILSPILIDFGPQHVLQIVGTPGGPMDAWPDRPTAQEQWRLMMRLLREHAPTLAERVDKAELLAEEDVSLHKYSPHVRNPVGVLPSGGLVLGMADAVISTDDPIAGQANNVSVASANHYLSRILACGTGQFDRKWMEDTFTGFWEGTPDPDGEFPFAGMGQAAAGLTQVLDQIWSPDAPTHLTHVLGAAVEHQQVADRFIGDLDDPRRYAEWLYDPDTALDFLAKATASAVLD